MAKKQAEQEVERLVREFVDNLTAVIQKSALESVQEAFGGVSTKKAPRAATGAATATRKKPVRRRRKGGRRTPEEVAALGVSIKEYVAANPGQRLEEIGVGMDMPTAELKRPIQNMLEEKALRTTGQKRGTKYFVKG